MLHVTSMNVKIANVSEFINCIHDYIIEEYEIIPRDFETQLYIGEQSLVWCNGAISEFHCPHFDKYFHVHEHEEVDTDDKSDDKIICCSQLDIIALKYLEGSIFGALKREIIKSLHDWLPAVTFQTVDVTFDKTCRIVRSYFEPSYLFWFLHTDAVAPNTQITYKYYFNGNIVYSNYSILENEREIMVRTRSRSRSRSRSSSPSRYGGGGGASSGGRKRRPGRPRKSEYGARSRRRSRSPSMSRSGGGQRRRSRSRSSSRSRY